MFVAGLIPSTPIGQRRVRVLNDPIESAKGIAPRSRPITDPVVLSALANIRVNDPTGQVPYTGNTQMEPTVAANGDTLVCAFTDSQGFFGSGTLTGYAISFNGGQTWYDAGSLPRMDRAIPRPSSAMQRWSPTNRATGIARASTTSAMAPSIPVTATSRWFCIAAVSSARISYGARRASSRVARPGIAWTRHTW
jgi:hypothetical protein